MLRPLVFLFGLVLIVAGIFLAVTARSGAAMTCLLFGSLLVLGTVFEQRIYKPVLHRPPPGPDWTRTEERFVDDKTGKTIAVYIKAETGERAYVVETDDGPA